jgi:hypothetical protein
MIVRQLFFIATDGAPCNVLRVRFMPFISVAQRLGAFIMPIAGIAESRETHAMPATGVGMAPAQTIPRIAKPSG